MLTWNEMNKIPNDNLICNFLSRSEASENLQYFLNVAGSPFFFIHFFCSALSFEKLT